MKAIRFLVTIPLLAVSANAASLITNGSFEDQATSGDGLGGFLGWTTSGSPTASTSANFFNQSPSEGSYLSYWGASGYVEQTLNTLEVGKTYNVTWDWGFGVNNTSGAERTASTSVLLGGSNVYTSPTYSHIASGGTQEEIWHSQSFDFVATGTSTTIRFVSTVSSGSQTDSFMDNVSVTPVPEPSGAAIFGLAGFSALLLRRRTR